MLGLKKNPCGCAIVTNVGMFNVETIYPCFPPICRVPIVAVVSSIRDEPIVVGHEIIVEKVLTMGVTLDHRFIDASKAVCAVRRMQDLLENPDLIELA